MSNQTSEMHNVNQGKISSKTVNRSKTNDHQRSRLSNDHQDDERDVTDANKFKAVKNMN